MIVAVTLIVVGTTSVVVLTIVVGTIWVDTEVETSVTVL